MSFQLAKFSQGALLRNVADPEVRGGVCVALCDIWLKSILDNPKVEPPHRMAFMASAMGGDVAPEDIPALRFALPLTRAG